jgi:hypothetical protein
VGVDELMREVRAATRARSRADQAAEAARQRQAVAVRAAMAAKLPVADLLRETGLTRARLYQIQAGRRTLSKSKES